MRTSLNLLMLSTLLGCFLASSSAAQYGAPLQAQNTGTPVFGGPNAVTGAYTPAQPNAIYTNTVYSNPSRAMIDPLAAQERSTWYPGMSGQPYAEGYAQACTDGSCGGTCGGTCGSCTETAGCQTNLSCESEAANGNNRGLVRGKWYVTGWLDNGYTYNFGKPQDRQNGPLKFNDRNEEYQLNQLYLSMGRAAATSGCKFDIGGRVDLMYGADYFWTSAIGLETRRRDSSGSFQEDPTALPSHWNRNNGPRFSFGAGGVGDSASRFGLALPQAYAEFYAPIGHGMNIKAGHFYSIMGYESVMSPENFFYSHSYAMMYGEPMTHTGLLVSQKLSPSWTGYFGLTRGWDTFEDPNGKLSYLGGVRWTSLDKRTDLSFVAATGNETVSDPNVQANSREDAIRSNYSIVLSHQLTQRLKLVTQHDMGYERDAAYNIIDGRQQLVGAHWYSLGQYAFYQLTDTLSFGVRGEWFRDVNSGRILRVYPIREELNGNLISEVNGKDYTQITMGFNWKPTDNLVIRPEGRWDSSGVCILDGSGSEVLGGVFDNFNSKKQFTTSVSAILTY